MTRRAKKAITVLTTAAAVVVAIATWLTLAVEPEERVEDRPRDLKLSLSPRRPPEKAVADIRFAQVRSEPRGLVFEAVVSETIPASVAPGYFDAYWEIDGETDWRLTITVDSVMYATLVSTATQSGTSTSTGTLDAVLETDGGTLRVVLRDAARSALPEQFRWKLTTRLNMRALDPLVGVMYDYAPEGRYGNFHL